MTAINLHELQEENGRLREQNAHLLTTLEEIRHKLTDPEEIIRAISRGEIDALVLQNESEQEEIYSLQRFASLRESEERNRLMVEGVKDYAIYLVDPEGHIVNWNNGAFRIYGYSAEEIIGQARSRFFNPEDVARGMPQHELSAAAKAGQFSEESWRVRKDGSQFWAEGTISALRDAAGELRGFVKVIRDLTERKHAEEAMRDSAERLRIAVKAANIGLWDWNLETNQVQFSAEWKSQIGYDDHEIGNDFDEWKSRVHPDDLAKTLSSVERFLANPTSMYQAEFRLHHRDGSYRWILAQGSLSRNEFGAQRHIIGSHIDITARVASETAIHLRDRALQAVLQGILITDPSQFDNPIIYASPGAERMTGYRADELLGRNCRFLQGEKTDPQSVGEIRKAINAGQDCSIELINYRKDGTPFWNALFITPVRDDQGRLLNFIGVQADVTERRNLETQFRQAQKMEAFGQLAGGVAHDFNNLLTIINGYSDMLLQSLPKEDPNRTFISEIHKAGERSAGLTRQLLAFSRQQVLAPQILNLNEVVSETNKMLLRLIGEDIRLTLTTTPKLGWIRADPGQIEQVLLNLVVNARDAMPSGGQLTIETQNVELNEAQVRGHASAHAGPHVLLSVTDTGCGMPPEVLSRIFEPFFTTKEQGKGTGLGLATVFGIVEQSGGLITVDSRVGIGTTFNIYLPRVEQTPEASGTQSRILKPPRGTETILLVEDDQAVLKLASGILTKCGYRVLSAGEGDEALRIAAGQKEPIHLLITDVVMPGMGGRNVAGKVADHYPGIRVLFISGYTDDAVLRHGVLGEGVNFLQKPFSPVALAFKVREVLDGSTET